MTDGHRQPLESALSGRYTLERALGQGGMATVYLARDLKHDRSVALKVLKPELAAVVGAERFLAEIRTTANLQHPNVLPLYDSGEAGGFLYYVMPHVEGETLRDRLERERQLPVEEAVRIATAVATALDFAHSHGVIHRDIKPGNILFQGGQPVVGDFGIALAVGAGSGARLTETGLSLGTPYYMSPEQATGEQHVGARSDLYSLGCVLYEMLVGDPPYVGSTAQAVLGQIITAKPVSAAEKRSAVPPNVDAAIRRALEKVPADRFATAGELAAALSDPAFRHGTLPGGADPGALRRWKISTGVAALVAIVAIGWAALRPGDTTDRQPRRYRLETLPRELIRYRPVLSPDGSSVAFSRAGEPDASEPDGLWIQAWDGLPPTWVPGTEGANATTFSPDGASVAFMAGGDLRVVTLDGSRPRTIVPGAGFSSLAWGDDGFIYGAFSSTSRPTILRLPEGGGEPEEVTARVEDRTHMAPEPLPGGRGLLFSSHVGLGFNRSADSVGVLDLQTHEQRILVPGRFPWYSPTGHLVYQVDDRLAAVPFDIETLAVTGPPSVIDDRVAGFVGSRSGSLILAEGAPARTAPELVWVHRDGTETVVDWPFEVGSLPWDPVISPDGSRVALSVVTGGERLPDVLVRNLADGTTTHLGLGIRPGWSQDGLDIGFQNRSNAPDPDAKHRIYRRRADASAPAAPITTPIGDLMADLGRWSPGRPLVLGTPTGLAVVDPGDTVPRVILDGLAQHANPALSPDGRWVAFTVDVSDETRVFVRPYPDVASALHAISPGYGDDPQWSPDGRTLYYEADGEEGRDVIAARLRTDPDFAVLSREPLVPFQRGYSINTGGWLFAVAPDGERVLISRYRREPWVQTGLVFVEDLAAELRRAR